MCDDNRFRMREHIRLQRNFQRRVNDELDGVFAFDEPCVQMRVVFQNGVDAHFGETGGFDAWVNKDSPLFKK